MLFPQISTGALTQLPFKATSRYQTHVNELLDLHEYVYYEQANPLGRWEVNCPAIPNADADTLAAFFATQKGRYGRFTFLDPTRNLLKWSEDFSQAVWTRSNVTAAGAYSDPFGGTAAQLLTASAPAAGAWQGIGYGPETYWFTGSIWLKAGSLSAVDLKVNDGAAQETAVTVALTSAWQRFSVSRKFTTGAGSNTYFVLGFPVAGVVYAFGAMLAYLPGPGDYGRTQNTCGVHPVCRFDDDKLMHRLTHYGVSELTVPVIEIAG